MAVLLNYPSFRSQFSNKKTEDVPNTITFDTIGSPEVIFRAGGSFVNEGYEPGMYMDIYNTASNDGRVQIELVTAATLVLMSSESLTYEVCTTAEFTYGFYDKDGLETWPYENMRANGFDGGITGFPSIYTGGQLILTCNGGAADAAQYVDEYDWYLSQRTDDPVNQPLTIVQKPLTGGNTYSGTVIIDISQSGYDLAGTSTIRADEIALIFKHCHLYVQRYPVGGSKAIQWTDLTNMLLAGY